MTQTYRLIVGVDGSEAGQHALNWAVAEAGRRREAGQQTSIQAIAAWQFEPVNEPVDALVRLPDPRVECDRILSHAIAVARAAHPYITIAGEVVEGPAADILVRAADDADLLVLGSHGHSHLYHAGLGPVAEACVRNATRPVVVIPMALSASTSAIGEALATTAG